MKKYFGVLLLFVALFITACGSGAAVYGTWTLEKVTKDGTSYTVDELKSLGESAVGSDVMSMADMTIVIKESDKSDSGSAFIGSAGQTAAVEWSLEGNKLKVGVQEGELDGDYLILSPNESSKMYFKKTSDSQDISNLPNKIGEAVKEDSNKDTEPEETDTPSDDDSESKDADMALTGDEYTYDSFVCRDTTDGKVEIVQYKGNEDTVTIPSEINDKKVISIGESAFEGNTTVESFVIWPKLKSVGARAFKGCTALEDISLSSKVDIIRESTFEGCKKLKTVILWGDIKEFEKNAFKDCESLSDISISSKCKRIGESAFENCTSMESVIFWGCEEICDKAFKNCKSLEEASLPSELETIGSEAFYGCEKLKKAYCWNSDLSVASDAFDNCPKLEEHP